MVDAEPILLRDAAEHGTTPDSLLRRVRAGELVRIQPGAYMPSAEWARLRPEARLRLRVLASHQRLGGDLVYSHESAAVILGIPLLGALPERPHILDASPAARSSPAMRRTVREIGLGDTAVTHGIRTTNPVETAIDLAATRTPLGAVIAISHVRNRHAVTLEDIEDLIAARGAFRGVRQVVRALATSSESCESALEAVVLARCEDLGFARPEQQRVISTATGAYRVDFAWDDGRLVLEADGEGKYTDARLLAGRTPAEAVIAEKRREDAIREVVAGFARTTWAEAVAGDLLARRLARLGVPRIRRPRMLRR